MDPFEILGVSPSAEREVMRAAFLALAKKYHPDGKPDPAQVHDRMVELNWAWGEIERDLEGWRERSSAAPTHPGETRSDEERHSVVCPNCSRLLSTPPGKVTCALCKCRMLVDDDGTVSWWTRGKTSAGDAPRGSTTTDSTPVSESNVPAHSDEWFVRGCQSTWLVALGWTVLKPYNWLVGRFDFQLPDHRALWRSLGSFEMLALLVVVFCLGALSVLAIKPQVDNGGSVAGDTEIPA